MRVLPAFLFFIPFIIFAQKTDSTALISEVVIDGYRKPQKLLNTTQSAAVTSPLIISQSSPNRMLESFNLLPGAKMEERSPGSYRFSVRGSTLRSPFGIRNVKMYLDDFLLTDVSGTTYLNRLDPALISKAEVLKGPQGGEFGAVTGGTVLLKTQRNDVVEVALHAGSYGLFKENINVSETLGDHSLQIFQSFAVSDSYREQSAMKRANFFLQDRWKYSEKGDLNFLLFYSDLKYETPGGLTLAQMQENRRQARPGNNAQPGVVQQNSGIDNQYLLAGISHKYSFSPSFSHFIVVQSGFSGINNPFITNYEKKHENNFSGRTHFNFEKQSENWFLQTRTGIEGGYNSTLLRNFTNNSGTRGNAMNFTEVSSSSGFVFLSQKAVFKDRFFIDAAVSANFMKYDWKNIFPAAGSGSATFETQILPDLGAVWMITPDFSLRGKLGKGNSYPTLEEFRASDQVINPDLKSELGWNKEVGIRKQFGNFLFAEVSAFDFRLKNAIVRKQNENGDEYFTNAGGTVQKGLEFILETKKFTINSNILNSVKLYFSGSLYDFTFQDYLHDGNDYSGNKMTGVPAKSLQSLMNIQLFNFMNIEYGNYFTSAFPLNDTNAVHAEEMIVGNLTARFSVPVQKKNLNFYAQIQNIYNDDLVLGYDINAFGGRYYNPSAERNFAFGASFVF